MPSNKTKFFSISSYKDRYKYYKSNKNLMYQIASISKMVTTIIVAKLYELKMLDYDTNINTYLNVWKCPATHVVTLRMLMNHTSGLDDCNGFQGYEFQKVEQNLQLNMDILDGKLSSQGVRFGGTVGVYHYSGNGYQIIQQVLEEITGIRFYKLLEQYIFKPLKMKHSTGKLLYPGKHKYKLANSLDMYRMMPETAAAGIWMSVGDMHILLNDLMDVKKSKILKYETIINHPIWLVTGKFKISCSGHNCGYVSYIKCTPGYIYILMANYIPKTISDNIMQDASDKIKI